MTEQRKTEANSFMLVPTSHPNYDPGKLFNHVKKRMAFKTDSELARCLGVHPSLISHLRANRSALTSNIAVAVIDATGMSLDEIRRIAGAV